MSNKFIRPPMLSTHFNGGKKSVKQRLTNILDMSIKRRGITALCVIMLVVTIAGALVACRKVESENSLYNEITHMGLGFSIEFPASWQGKEYGFGYVRDDAGVNDNMMEVYHLGIRQRYDEEAGRLFWISRYSDNAKPSFGLNTTYLGENDGYTYYFHTPNDVQYQKSEDAELAEEYDNMANDIPEIRESIKLEMYMESMSSAYMWERSDRIEIINNIIDEGWELSVNSGRGDTFVLEEDLVGGEFDLEKTAQSNNIDITNYYGKEIDVLTYDAMNYAGRSPRRTYAFIFFDDELIGYKNITNSENSIAFEKWCSELQYSRLKSAGML